MDDLVRCVDAIERVAARGFGFWRLRDSTQQVTAICGYRWRGGVVDTYTVRGAANAYAERYLPEQFRLDEGEPLWQAHGDVVEVLERLLALPSDTPGVTA